MDLSEWVTSPDWWAKVWQMYAAGGLPWGSSGWLCALNAGGLDLIPRAATKDPAYSTKIQHSKINKKLKTIKKMYASLFTLLFVSFAQYNPQYPNDTYHYS